MFNREVIAMGAWNVMIGKLDIAWDSVQELLLDMTKLNKEELDCTWLAQDRANLLFFSWLAHKVYSATAVPCNTSLPAKI